MAVLATVCIGCQPKERADAAAGTSPIATLAPRETGVPSVEAGESQIPVEETPQTEESPIAVLIEQPAIPDTEPAHNDTAMLETTSEETDEGQMQAAIEPSLHRPRAVDDTGDQSPGSGDAADTDSAAEEAATETPTEEDATGAAIGQPEELLDFALSGPRIHARCQDLLNAYVDEHGNVDYATLRRKRSEIYAIVRDFENLDPREYLPWERNEKIAFWLNAYNVFTLKVVVDNYPIEPTWAKIMQNYPRNSIVHIRDAWTKKYFTVLGVEYTLREIEREMLLGGFGDLRVSLALTYASMGGAMLRNEAFHPDKLDEQLDDQARRFLANPRGFEIAGRIVYLADIFNWYRQDYIAKYGDIRKFRDKPQHIQAYLNFIVNYISPADARFLEMQDYTVEFRKYDWRLNEQPAR